MKTLVIALFLAASAFADVNFYYVVEAAPASLPGADIFSAGIMVLVSNPADETTVCVSYTTSDGIVSQKCGIATDDGLGYSIVRLDIGADAMVINIAVTGGSDKKSIDDPVPGVEY